MSPCCRSTLPFATGLHWNPEEANGTGLSAGREKQRLPWTELANFVKTPQFCISSQNRNRLHHVPLWEKKPFPVSLLYKTSSVCMLLNTGVILKNLGSAKLPSPKRYAIMAEFMNFIQHTWNAFYHLSLTKVKLGYD